MADTWAMIDIERGLFADRVASLAPQQWQHSTLCDSWNVRDLVGHAVATGEMTQPKFFTHFARNGFNFDSMVDRDSHAITSQATDDQLIDRLRAKVGGRNHPPGPITAMLGEAMIHAEDVFRALGQPIEHPVDNVVAVADFYKSSNLIVGAKKRIAGLSLKATDSDWATGSGDEVAGRSIDLLLVMTGRKSALENLTGPGVATLAQRP